MPFTETLKAVNEMYKEGRFKTFALSNYTAGVKLAGCITSTEIMIR